MSYLDFKWIGLWGLDSERVWSRSILPKCVWERCQISMAKIQLHFALFSGQKFSSALPQVRHSTQNTILTKLSPWEYNNRDALFSQWKSGRVLRLVCYGALARFRACVYGTCQHAYTRTSRSLSKLQVYWYVLHTRGNRCHMVTWIGMVISRFPFFFTIVAHRLQSHLLLCNQRCMAVQAIYNSRF